MLVDEVRDEFHQTASKILVQKESKIPVDEVRDSANDEGKKEKGPIFPKFVLAGMCKCGSSALKSVILKHPQVVPLLTDANRGTYFFQLFWRDDLPANVQMAEYAKMLQQDVLSSNPNMCSGDFTPAYIMGGTVIARRIKENLPGVKILIVLRDPVERAFSAYNYTIGNFNDVLEMVGGEPWTATFMDIVKEGLAELDSAGINSDTDLKKNEFFQNLLSEKEVEIHKKILVMFHGMMKFRGGYRKGSSQKVHSATGPRLPADIARLKAREILGISPTDDVESANEIFLNFSNQLRRVLGFFTVFWGMYALVLEQWYEVFGSDMLVFSTEGLFSENFQKTLDSIFSHIGLPTYEGANEVQNAGSYLYKDEQDEEARATLREFYKPHNSKLAKLLKKNSVDTSADMWPWLPAE